MPQTRTRDGRYSHVWGWQGFDSQGREWSDCQHCGRWAINGEITRQEPPELRASPDAWGMARTVQLYPQLRRAKWPERRDEVGS